MTELERLASNPELAEMSQYEREYRISAALEKDVIYQQTASRVFQENLEKTLGRKLKTDVPSLFAEAPYQGNANALIYKIMNEGVNGRYSDVNAVQHLFNSFARGVFGFIPDAIQAAGILATGTDDNFATDFGRGVESVMNSFFVTDLDRDQDFWLTAVPQGVGQVASQVVMALATGGAGNAARIAATGAAGAAKQTVKATILATMQEASQKALVSTIQKLPLAATIVPSVFMESFEENISAGMSDAEATLNAIPVTAVNTAIEKFALDRILSGMVIKNKSVAGGVREFKKYLSTIPDSQRRLNISLNGLLERGFYGAGKIGLQYATGYAEEALQSIVTDIGAGRTLDLSQAHFEGLVGGVVQSSVSAVGAALAAKHRKQELLENLFERKQEVLAYYNLKENLDERDRQIFDALNNSPDIDTFAKFVGVSPATQRTQAPAQTQDSQPQQIGTQQTQQPIPTESAPESETGQKEVDESGKQETGNELPEEVRNTLLSYRESITQRVASFHELLNLKQAEKIKAFFGEPARIGDRTKRIMTAATNRVLAGYILDPRTIPSDLIVIPEVAPRDTFINALKKYVVEEYQKISNKPDTETQLNAIESARRAVANRFADNKAKSDFSNLMPLVSATAARAYNAIQARPPEHQSTLLDELAAGLDIAKASIEKGSNQNTIKALNQLQSLEKKARAGLIEPTDEDLSLNAHYAFYLSGLNPLVKTKSGSIGNAEYSIKDGRLMAHVGGSEYNISDIEVLSTNAIDRLVPPETQGLDQLKNQAIFSKRILGAPQTAPDALGGIESEVADEAAGMRFLENVATTAAINFGYSPQDLLNNDFALQETANLLKLQPKNLRAAIEAMDEVIPDFFTMKLQPLIEEKLKSKTSAVILELVNRSTVFQDINPTTKISEGVYSLPTFELPEGFIVESKNVTIKNSDVVKTTIKNETEKISYTIQDNPGRGKVTITKDTAGSKTKLIFNIRYNYNKTQSLVLESSTTNNAETVREMAALAAIHTTRYLYAPESSRVIEFKEEMALLDPENSLLRINYIEDYTNPSVNSYTIENGTINLSKSAIDAGYTPLDFLGDLADTGVIGGMDEFYLQEAGNLLGAHFEQKRTDLIESGLNKKLIKKRRAFVLADAPNVVAARIAVIMAKNEGLSGQIRALNQVEDYLRGTLDKEKIQAIEADSDEVISLAFLKENNLLAHYVVARRALPYMAKPDALVEGKKIYVTQFEGTPKFSVTGQQADEEPVQAEEKEIVEVKTEIIKPEQTLQLKLPSLNVNLGNVSPFDLAQLESDLLRMLKGSPQKTEYLQDLKTLRIYRDILFKMRFSYSGLDWLGAYSPQTNSIYINASNIKPDQVPAVLDEELGHALWESGIFKKEFDALLNALTDKERKEIESELQSYDDYLFYEEVRVKAFSKIRQRARNAQSGSPLAAAWKAFVEIIKKFWRRITGRDHTDIESLAEKMFNVGLRIMRDGQRAIQEPIGVGPDSVRQFDKQPAAVGNTTRQMIIEQVTKYFSGQFPDYVGIVEGVSADILATIAGEGSRFAKKAPAKQSPQTEDVKKTKKATSQKSASPTRSRAYLRNLTATEALNKAAERLSDEGKLDSLDTKKLAAMIAAHKLRKVVIPKAERPLFRKISKPKSVKAWQPFQADEITLAVGDSKGVIAYATFDERGVPSLLAKKTVDEEKRRRALNILLTTLERSGTPVYQLPEIPTEDDVSARLEYLQTIAFTLPSTGYRSNAARFGVESVDVEDYISDTFSVSLGQRPSIRDNKISEVEDMLAYFESLMPNKTIADSEYLGDVTTVVIKNESSGLVEPMVVYNPRHLADYLLRLRPEKRKDALNRLALHEFIHAMLLKSESLMKHVEVLAERLLQPANANSSLARSILSRRDIIDDNTDNRKVRIGMEGIRAAIEAILTGQTSELSRGVDSTFLETAHIFLREALKDPAMSVALRESLTAFFGRLGDPTILVKFDKGSVTTLISKVKENFYASKIPSEDNKLITAIFDEIAMMVDKGTPLEAIIKNINKYYPPSANNMDMAKRNMAARMATSLLLVEMRQQVRDIDPLQARKLQDMAVRNLTPTFETASQAGSLLNFWKLLLQRDPEYLYANFLNDLIENYKQAAGRSDRDTLVVEDIFSMARNQKFLAKAVFEDLHTVVESLIAEINEMLPDEKKINTNKFRLQKNSINYKNLQTLKTISELMQMLKSAQARLLAAQGNGFNAILRDNPLLSRDEISQDIEQSISALQRQIAELRSQLVGINNITEENIDAVIARLENEINLEDPQDTFLFRILDEVIEQTAGQPTATEVMTRIAEELGLPLSVLRENRGYRNLVNDLNNFFARKYGRILGYSLDTFMDRFSPNIKRMALELLGDEGVAAIMEKDPTLRTAETLFYNLIYRKQGGAAIHSSELDRVRNLFVRMVEAPAGAPQDAIRSELEEIFSRATSANVLDVMNAVRKAFLISGAGTFFLTASSATLSSAVATLSYLLSNSGSLRRNGFEMASLNRAYASSFRRALEFAKQAWRGEYVGRYELERVKPMLERIAKGKQIHGNIAKYLTPGIRPFAKFASFVVRLHNVFDAFTSNMMHDVYLALAAPGATERSRHGGVDLSQMDMREFVEYFFDERSPAFQNAARETDEEIKQGLIKSEDRYLRIREKLELTLPPMLLDNARAIGSYVTMMRDITGNTMGGFLGEIGLFINKLKYKTTNPHQRAIIDYYFPFVTSGVNVVNFTLNFTPVGLLRTELGYLRNLSPDLKNMIRLQSIMGTVVFLAILAAALYYDDEDDPFVSITGSLLAAGDYRRRRQLLQAGMMPYTLKIGPFVINYKDLIPALAVVGNIADSVRFRKRDGKTGIAEHLFVGLLQGPQVLMDMTALQSLGSIFGSDSVGKSTLEKFIESAARGASSYVTPSIIRDFEAWFYNNKIYQKPDNVWGYFLQQFPIVRNFSGEQPLIDIFGREAKNPRNPFTRVFGTSPDAPEEILAVKMFKNGYLPAAASRIIPYSEDKELNRQIAIDSLKIFWDSVLADKDFYMEMDGKTLVKAAKALYKESLKEAFEQNGFEPERKKSKKDEADSGQEEG